MSFCKRSSLTVYCGDDRSRIQKDVGLIDCRMVPALVVPLAAKTEGKPNPWHVRIWCATRNSEIELSCTGRNALRLPFMNCLVIEAKPRLELGVEEFVRRTDETEKLRSTCACGPLPRAGACGQLTAF